jgi:uncharacterized HAD superfamily protein
MEQKTLGIDFDGTLCKKQPYGDGLIYEGPNTDARKVMQNLREEGFRLVVFTTRLNPGFPGNVDQKLHEIENWLIKHDIPFDLVTNNKPSAIAYIDDRAIRFTNWQDISNYFCT